jgi:tetratricopeptide (TPR) repeat protein
MERAAVNAVRSIFEQHGCIFQEVDGANDYGKDAYVDLTENGLLSGTCAALQIKGGRSFGCATRGYRIPADASHRHVWRESTIPVMGIVYDPAAVSLHWVNLTEFLRVHRKESGAIPVPLDNRLQPQTILTDFRTSIENTPAWIPRALNPNLPAAPALVGRDDQLKEVADALRAEAQFVVIEGIGGVGKTALALNVAHELFNRQTVDRVVWATSKGRHLSFEELLDIIATGLDQPYLTALDAPRKHDALLNILRQVACLVIVDNLDTLYVRERYRINAFLEQVEFPSKVLVTMRPPLPMEFFAPPMASIKPLSGLNPTSCRALIRAEAERLRLPLDWGAHAESIEQLIRITEGNPLGISISLGQLTIAPSSLAELVAELACTPDRTFDYLYGRSWNAISAQSRHVLCAASLFATTFTKDAIFEIAGNERTDLLCVEASLAQLAHFGLVRPNAQSASAVRHIRLELHPLTKAFAESRLRRNGRKRRALYGKLATFYEHFAEKHKVRFWGGRENYGPLELERDNLLATLHWCVQAKMYDRVAAMCAAIADFLIVRGDWNLCLELGMKGETAARMAQLPLRRAWIKVHMIGYILANRRDFLRAEEAFMEAIAILETHAAESEELSEAHRNLGRVKRQQRRWDDADASLNLALAIANRVGSRRGMALALNEIGKKFRDQEDSAKAAEYFHQALAVLGEEDNSINAGILCNLAGVEITLGSLSTAKQNSEKALEFFLRIDNAEGIASTKWRLAEILGATGSRSALVYAEDAVRLFKGLGMTEEVRAMERIIISVSGMQGVKA